MQLTAGAIEKIKSGDIANDAVTVQISGLVQVPGKGRHECTLTDGKSSISGITNVDVSSKILAGDIKDGSLIEMTDYACNFINGQHKIILTGCKPLGEAPAAVVKQEPAGPSGEAPQAATPGAAKARPADESEAAAAPAEKRELLPKTPVSQIRAAFKQEQMMTPGLTPSPFTARLAGGGGRIAYQPIATLNPYSNDWTIRAKLVSKAPLRHFDKGGQQQAVFSIEVVDEQGTTIEITLWRGLAEKFHDHLVEGEAYYFRRGSVKLANKNYQTVRNDYVIHMDNGSEIEQCAGTDVSKMTAKLKYVDFERLPLYAGKKTLVDIMGVATTVGPIGSVKRSRDGTELARRDVTLVDQGAKTVVVTLWGTTAEEVGAQLEQQPDAVVSISSCRVTEYNGVSLSTVTRSAVKVEPEGDRAAALRSWWESDGRAAPTQHLGEGLASAKHASGGGAPERATFAELRVPKEELPPADSKPSYHTVVATVASIDAQQSLYYEACPENNRKVVKQGEGWFCEYDQQTYPSMVRRYVMLAKCVDASGDCLLSVFNEQAEAMLGMSADEIAVLKEDAEPAKYEAVLKRAQWTEWVLRVQCRTQEYQGDLRQRLSVASLKPVSFVEESRRMVQELERMRVAAA
ncbi:Replication protein A 70 kDa DNA-binding subunit B [Coccomyxa sp. Obi]|nr:Replication protein A 70 kDa DNA-binding subunit B [Coccomyxa sp. Obi]